MPLLYLLAAIGVVVGAAMLWRLLAPERVGAAAHRRRIAPDDDPEFLRQLGERNRRRDHGDQPGDQSPR